MGRPAAVSSWAILPLWLSWATIFAPWRWTLAASSLRPGRNSSEEKAMVLGMLAPAGNSAAEVSSTISPTPPAARAS